MPLAVNFGFGHVLQFKPRAGSQRYFIVWQCIALSCIVSVHPHVPAGLPPMVVEAPTEQHNSLSGPALAVQHWANELAEYMKNAAITEILKMFFMVLVFRS